MRKLLVIIFSSFSVVSFGQGISFIITGNFLDQTHSTTVYIGGPAFYDSVKLDAGNAFQYQGKMGKPGLVTIATENSNPATVWINSGAVQVELVEYEKPESKQAEKKNLKIHSTRGVNEAEAYQRLTDELETIAATHPKRDILGVDSLMLEFFPLVSDFTKRNKNSYLSVSLASSYPFSVEEKKELLAIIGNSPDKEGIETLKTQIERSELLQRGKKIDNFVQPTSTGEPIEFYAIKSRFVLIQFWASWSPLCRAQHPQLVALYSKYHPRGLEIIGISLDDLISEWTNAIAKDQLYWINVSDLLVWKNEMVKKYKIDHVPFNILVDNTYSVIAFDLNPAQLSEVLDRYLAN